MRPAAIDGMTKESGFVAHLAPLAMLAIGMAICGAIEIFRGELASGFLLLAFPAAVVLAVCWQIGRNR